ncbi:MAG: hypothetical protein Q9225_004565 [Loekoesia sp. 1 TL-2023]
MAPRKGSRAPGAARAGGCHVKTGCITCKIRHVKCDEAKPKCNKCESTGRKCDGYGPRKDPPISPDDERRKSVTWRNPGGELSLTLNIPTTWNGTIDEFRGFDYFRLQTSEDLAYSLNSSLEELVLQTSHHHEAIKHAAIALGSLGHTIRINSAASPGQFSALSRHEFACRQYYKAIKILQKDMVPNDKDSVNFALISCFLFIVFEFLQGNDPSAVTHLRSGLNILRQQYSAHVHSHPDTDTISTARLDPIQASIARIFSILDSQSTTWLDLRTFNARSSIPIDHPVSREMVPESYSSLDEACQDLDDIISRVYNFRRHASKHDFAPTRADIPATIYAQRDSLLDELDVHRRRLSNYLTGKQTFCQHPEDPYRITVLRINRKVTTLMLAIYLEPNESSFYDHAQPVFLQIVSLATLILRPETSEMRQMMLGGLSSRIKSSNKSESTNPQQREIFSFFAGLIQPLYFTAIKCSDQETAMKAIELLEMEPWKEGSWDSAAMAKVARTRFLELSRWRSPTEAGGIAVPGRDTGGEGLSIDWPLATDPLITYPV